MELVNSPMTERQLNYRQVYRERIATWYNGFVHVALIYTIGLGAMLRFYVGPHRGSPFGGSG